MEFVIIIILVVIIVIIVYHKIKNDKLLRTATERHRGTRSERKLVLKMLKSNFDARVVFHDLYIKKSNSGYSQIDMVVPTKVGIFVFEVKDYSGWIFGNCYNRYWTQILAYGRDKYRFYNPIKQNQGHIQTLQHHLSDTGDIPYYSIVVFYGRCTLKQIGNLPDNSVVCYASQVKDTINHIMNTVVHKAHYTDKQKIMAVLREGVKNGANKDIQREHAQSLSRYR